MQLEVRVKLDRRIEG